MPEPATNAVTSPPASAALAQHAQAVGRELAVVVMRRNTSSSGHLDHAPSRPGRPRSARPSRRPRPRSCGPPPWPAAARSSRRRCARRRSPTRARRAPSVGRRAASRRLLLGAHDRLDRGQPGVVDRVGDRDHRRQRRLDQVVAVLGLALRPDAAALELELGDLRRPAAAAGGRRPPRPSRSSRRRRPAGRAARGRRPACSQHRRQRVRGARMSEPASAGSVTQHGPVGAQRQRLLQGPLRRVSGPMQTADDLAHVAPRLADPDAPPRARARRTDSARCRPTRSSRLVAGSSRLRAASRSAPP